MARVILYQKEKGIVDYWDFNNLEQARGKHEALLNALKGSYANMWEVKIKPTGGLK